jgi:N-acylglucosamine 2-epimerase
MHDHAFLRELAGRYRVELLDNIMPFWMRHSIDAAHGGFWSCLERDGTCFDRRKYVWMNGRQVWTLCKLYRTLEARAEWLEAARRGAEFLRAHVFDEQGRCWFALTADGRPAAAQRKPYGAVFVMLGWLEYAKASGDDSYRALALALYGRIERWLAEPAELGRAALAGAPRLAGLADIYVRCSMALEALEDDPYNAAWRAVLRRCLEDLPKHYETRHRLLYENAPLDDDAAATPDGRLICVGSIFEIHWLLWRAIDELGGPAAESPEEAGAAATRASSILNETLAGALEFGWDREYGGLFYFLDCEGHTPLQLEWSMKLWWVHVEAIYALLQAYVRTRDERWLGWLTRVDRWSWEHFRDTDYGEWYGYLDRAGAPALTSKGGNYKGCFHIPRALLYSVLTLRQAGLG